MSLAFPRCLEELSGGRLSPTELSFLSDISEGKTKHKGKGDRNIDEFEFCWSS